MRVGRVDDRDIEIALAGEQACGNGGTGRSAADDDDVMARSGLPGIDGAACSDAAGDAGHVEACRTRDADDLVQRPLAGLRQRPERRRARAAAAIGEHGFRQIASSPRANLAASSSDTLPEVTGM